MKPAPLLCRPKKVKASSSRLWRSTAPRETLSCRASAEASGGYPPISSRPDLVKSSSLKTLNAAQSVGHAAYMTAQEQKGINVDRTAMARATRDLRYGPARRSSAKLTEPDRDAEWVLFGSVVNVERPEDRPQTLRTVGEDEANPALELRSPVSPLAHVLTGLSNGDPAALAEALHVLEIGFGWGRSRRSLRTIILRGARLSPTDVQQYAK